MKTHTVKVKCPRCGEGFTLMSSHPVEWKEWMHDCSVTGTNAIWPVTTTREGLPS